MVHASSPDCCPPSMIIPARRVDQSSHCQTIYYVFKDVAFLSSDLPSVGFFTRCSWVMHVSLFICLGLESLPWFAPLAVADAGAVRFIQGGYLSRHFPLGLSHFRQNIGISSRCHSQFVFNMSKKSGTSSQSSRDLDGWIVWERNDSASMFLLATNLSEFCRTHRNGRCFQIWSPFLRFEMRSLDHGSSGSSIACLMQQTLQTGRVKKLDT